MPSDDTYTAIDGSQIRDNSISPNEMEVVNSASKWMLLSYTDEGSGNPDRFRWFHFIRGRIFS